MNTTDYIVNGILVLLVVKQIRGGRLDLTSLLLPVVLVSATAIYYLRSVPTAGNDLTLELTLAGVGALLGIGCGLATLLTRRQDGVHARAGVLAAVLWVLGMATRMGFAFASDHGAGGSIAHFSRTHQITGSQAWVAAFVLMALSEAVARLVAIRFRAWRLSAAPAVAQATV